ncbi:hypothetical protein SpAn4DRAFT_3089 [Sporomusa ovata]|uniref:Uncharacterized protein n=1 Tax=Sporomusa ovata TaxID=2378 RepID=A0A0U1KZT0_9FIRM|nr:hypothetical protein SpAn4DRAFT_3089 [Sporomusa ovata]
MPVTRLSATALALGWTKLTVSPLATEKLVQLIIALLLLWLIVVVLPVAVIVALPLVTLPLVGLAKAVL